MFLIIFWWNGILFAGGALKSSSDLEIKQKRFILQLFNRKRYFDCIGETRRLLSFNRNIDRNEDYNFFILGNYFSGRQYKTVIFDLDGNKPSLREKVLLSQSYLKLGMFSESYAILKDINYNGIRQDKRYNFFLRRVEPLINSGFYSMALKELQSAELYIPAEKYIQLQRSFNKFKRSGFKFPEISIALSAIIPGAGHIYSKRYIDGIISFAGIAATAGSAYYFLRKGDRGSGYTFAFFSVLFYGGNIYSAYNSANNYNRMLRRKFVKEMYQKHIPPYRPEEEIDLKRLFN